MDKLREKIQNSNQIVILSGAGLSAPSGIKTFKDQGGLWDTFRVADFATSHAFKINPGLAWNFYDIRRAELPTIEPNSAHRAIRHLQLTKNASILTQNVDNLLERAGCYPVNHLHGVITNTKCNLCGVKIFNDIEIRTNNYICVNCNGTLRPDVILFGEVLPPDVYYQSEQILSGLTSDDVLIVIGCSLEVSPVSNFPRIALSKKATIIEINPQPKLRGPGTHWMPMNCTDALKLLVQYEHF